MGYWIGRMYKGGEILAPGDPTSPVQYIDARDLAEWVVSMVERCEIGTYNAAGPHANGFRRIAWRDAQYVLDTHETYLGPLALADSARDQNC